MLPSNGKWYGEVPDHIANNWAETWHVTTGECVTRKNCKSPVPYKEYSHKDFGTYKEARNHAQSEIEWLHEAYGIPGDMVDCFTEYERDQDLYIYGFDGRMHYVSIFSMYED
jgi:hypothetical protein